MSTAKNTRRKPRLTNRKPRILVMEGLSGAATCVKRAGGEPITVNPRVIDDVDEALAGKFDGLLLTGGGDVDPRLYGEKPHKRVYGVSETRDYTEWMALDRAAELGVPVMGICRGHQLMTVHNGGALRQHLEGHRGMDHLVYGESGSRFRRIIGGERGKFVSLHHQVVKRTGNGWRVAARDRTGIIEAVESKDGRCLGVQFHPEMDYHGNECSKRLFDWLVTASAKRAKLVKPERVKGIQRYTSTEPVRPRRKANSVRVNGLTPTEFQRHFRENLRTGGSPEQLDLLIEAAKRGSRRAPVTVRHFCRDCGMEFDKQVDRDDHEYWICGSPQMRTTEPPPGHPDWVA